VRPPSGTSKCLLHHGLLLPMHEEQEERCGGEEDAIHDPKRKGRLFHGALFVEIGMDWTRSTGSIRAHSEVKGVVNTDV